MQSSINVIKPNITPISWPTEGGGTYGFLGCWLDILTTLNEPNASVRLDCFDSFDLDSSESSLSQ